MTVQNVKLSTSISEFVQNEVPESAQNYIQTFDQAIANQAPLLNSSRRHKNLALASVAVLTGLPFTPLALPVIVTSVVVASLFALYCGVKVYLNSSSIKSNKLELFNTLYVLERNILYKFLVDLPQIFKDKYDTLEEEKTTVPDRYFPVRRTYPQRSMTLKADVDLEQLQNQLRAWKEESRAIHGYSHVASSVETILPKPNTPSNAQERNQNQLNYFFNSQNFSREIDSISDVVEKILSGDCNDITRLIDSIEYINLLYSSLNILYSRLETDMGIEIEIPRAPTVQLRNPPRTQENQEAVQFTPVITIQK